jgi:hypothetical protein
MMQPMWIHSLGTRCVFGGGGLWVVLNLDPQQEQQEQQQWRRRRQQQQQQGIMRQSVAPSSTCSMVACAIS